MGFIGQEISNEVGGLIGGYVGNKFKNKKTGQKIGSLVGNAGSYLPLNMGESLSLQKDRKTDYSCS